MLDQALLQSHASHQEGIRELEHTLHGHSVGRLVVVHIRIRTVERHDSWKPFTFRSVLLAGDEFQER